MVVFHFQREMVARVSWKKETKGGFTAETSSKLHTHKKRTTKTENQELQKQTDIKLGPSSEIKTRQTIFEPLDLSEMKLNFSIYAQAKETFTPKQAHALLQDLLKEVRMNLEQKRTSHGCLRSIHCQYPGSAGTGKTETAANTVEMLSLTR